MSLGDLFSLLLFVLFIGAPLLSRFLRRGPPSGKAPPPTPRTGLPTTPPTQTNQTQTNQRRDAANAENAGDIGTRLEQARRRVREAVEGQTARADTRTAQNPTLSPTGLESAGDMFRQEPVRDVPPVGPVTASRPKPTDTLQQLSRRQGKRRTTRPLQVERSIAGKRAKLSSDMLRFDREDIMRGIIWQQILDAPKSKRPWRNPSQHP